jgi:hypothetical protein
VSVSVSSTVKQSAQMRAVFNGFTTLQILQRRISGGVALSPANIRTLQGSQMPCDIGCGGPSLMSTSHHAQIVFSALNVRLARC